MFLTTNVSILFPVNKRNLFIGNVLLLLLYSTSSYTFGTSANNNRLTSVFFRPLKSKSLHFLKLKHGGSINGDQTGLKASTTTGSTITTPVVSDFITEENFSLLSERGKQAIINLIQHDNQYQNVQKHIYANWPEPGVDDDGKRKLAEQIADLDSSYPGGLPSYLSKAKKLLKESADGANPFAEYEALVPKGESLSFEDGAGSTMKFSEAEQLGLSACSGAVFVLVAGGLGERLGYSGIKLSLENNLCTRTSYLELYAQYILAMQYVARKASKRDDINIPLVIMTSGDTDQLTRKLLKDNNYYGMNEDYVTIVMQDKVAALKDGYAGLALEDNDRWSIQTKPHGHGDVHHLLLRDGLIDKWEKEGKTHVIFIQDTNGLVINGVIPSLGVSVSKGFHMNSLCIPRLAGEAAGAIARLEHKSDPEKSLVINVEYNQLDPLLRTQGDCTGDVADPTTGYSPFPGNANNLVLQLSAYAKTLRGEDEGVVLEFVNPKYKDKTRTDFKKPTRLECMMQDIPKLFQKEIGASANIGFTTFDRWFTFSPAKNSLESGQESLAGGNTAPCTMSSAESDNYIQNQRKLKFIGVDLPVSNDDNTVSVAGIPVTKGPRIILHPSFGITRQELIEKVKGPVRITERSSVVLGGHHLSIKNLDVDGALIIEAGPDSFVTVDGLKVLNEGWVLEELDPKTNYPEEVRIRGYTMKKKETTRFIVNEPGNFVIDSSGQLKKLN